MPEENQTNPIVPDAKSKDESRHSTFPSTFGGVAIGFPFPEVSGPGEQKEPNVKKAAGTQVRTKIPDSRLKTKGNYFNWISDHFDLYDVVFLPEGAKFWQLPNVKIEEHLNLLRQGRHGVLPKLTMKKVAQACAGLANVHLIPRYSTKSGFVEIVVRLDADAHNGEPDAARLIQTISHRFFKGTLYDEPSARGHSAWLTITYASHIDYVTSFDPETGEYEYDPQYYSPRTLNRHLDDLQATLVDWAKRAGFMAQLELKGRFTCYKTDPLPPKPQPPKTFSAFPETLPDGLRLETPRQAHPHPTSPTMTTRRDQRIVERRGSRVKLPRLPNNIKDFVRLDNSTITRSEMIDLQTRLREDPSVPTLPSPISVALDHPSYVAPAISGQPTRALPKIPTPIRNQATSTFRPDIVEDTGDKNKNRLKCMYAAARGLWDNRKDRWPETCQLNEDEKARVCDYADIIYTDSGLADGPYDDKRRHDWLALLDYVLGKGRFAGDNPALAAKAQSKSSIRFDLEHDLAPAIEQLRGAGITDEVLASINAQNKKRFGKNGSRITIHNLALALLVCTANILNNKDNAAPHKGLEEYFKRHGLDAGWSVGGVLIETLVKCGFLRCIRAKIHPRSAKAFELHPALTNIPFVRHAINGNLITCRKFFDPAVREVPGGQ